MKVSARLQNYLIQALSQSMPVDLMEQLAGRAIPDYDLHRMSGFPTNIPIPQQDAAVQIVYDMIRQGHARRFAEVLIDVHRNGVMGRPVSIRILSKIIDEIEALGFVFKEDYGLFMEGVQARTKGWGVLKDGSIYEFSFLKMDIAGNTKLVRKYPKARIAKAYADISGLFTAIVERREGRLWHWEGDGGIAAFHFLNKNVQAALAGMEMLLELFMYNLFRCPFLEGLHVRLAVHTGPCQFYHNYEDIRSDTLRRIEVIESEFAATDSLMISPGVYSDMGTKLESFFRPVRITKRNFLYQYKLGWE